MNVPGVATSRGRNRRGGTRIPQNARLPVALRLDLLASPAALGAEGWERLRAEMLGDLPRRNCYAPHVDAIHRRAFDAVRARLLADDGGPLAPPVAYWVPKSNSGGRGGRQRRHALLRPGRGDAVDAPRHHHHHRRRGDPGPHPRPFRPGRTGRRPGLLTPPEQWTRSFSAGVEAAVAGPGAVARLDVNRCGERIRRDLLLETMTGLGLAPYWLDVARRFWAGCAHSLGPTGVPITGFVSASFVTVAIEPLDRWCAEHGIRSVRMMDDTVLLAPDLDAAAPSGRRRPPGPGQDWPRGAAGQDGDPDHGRVPGGARAGPPAHAGTALARRPGARPVPGDGARHPLPADRRRHAVAAGRRRRPPRARPRPGSLPHLPAAARTFANHVAAFIHDQAVADRLAAVLAGAGTALHPWQLRLGPVGLPAGRAIPGPFARGLSAMLDRPEVPVRSASPPPPSAPASQPATTGRRSRRRSGRSVRSTRGRRSRSAWATAPPPSGALCCGSGLPAIR